MEEKRTVSHLTEVREWYERYFTEHGTWPTTAAYARTLLELVDPEPAPENGRALLVDVACGGGHFLSHVPPGLYHRVGIDLSLTAASEAGHRASTPTVVAAAEALPLRDGIVDLLVCLGSFEHFVDKEATCREFARVTRSGGQLLVLLPCDRAWIEHDPQPIELVGTPEEWQAFFSDRGFLVDPPISTDAIPELAAASARCTVLRMKKQAESAADAFFAGPYEPDEVRRVLAAIDERLRLRAALNLPAHPTPGPISTWRDTMPAAPLVPDPSKIQVADDLRDMTAPLFNVRKGGRTGRLGKTILNLPLKVLGRPQLYFNLALRNLVGTWADLLRTMLTSQERLALKVTEARERSLGVEAKTEELGSQVQGIVAKLARVEQWLTNFETRVTGDEAWLRVTAGELHSIRIDALSAVRFGTARDRKEGAAGVAHYVADPEAYRDLCATMKDGLLVNLGCGPKVVPGYINVDARPLSGVAVVADVRDLPFPPESVAELFSAHLVEHFHRYEFVHRILPYWRTLIRPGGRLRIVCPNWQAAMDWYRSGKMGLELLHDITFGSQEYDGNDHLAMYTPATLPPLLEQAGFVACVVTVEDRDNDGCPEMEVVTHRPS